MFIKLYLVPYLIALQLNHLKIHNFIYVMSSLFSECNKSPSQFINNNCFVHSFKRWENYIQ